MMDVDVFAQMEEVDSHFSRGKTELLKLSSHLNSSKKDQVQRKLEFKDRKENEGD